LNNFQNFSEKFSFSQVARIICLTETHFYSEEIDCIMLSFLCRFCQVDENNIEEILERDVLSNTEQVFLDETRSRQKMNLIDVNDGTKENEGDCCMFIKCWLSGD
jgi:hypothetical protein